MAYTPSNPNGQTTKSASAPVTLASDQNNALETGGNLASIVTNTTGAATSALQSSGNGSLTTIVTNTGRIPAQGAATITASTPVNIASDQTVPISSATLATAANQTNGTQQIQGTVASGATDSGNPVKVGGVYVSTYPTLTTGQRSNLNVDSRGNLRVSLIQDSNTNAVGFSGTNSDAVGTDGSNVALKTNSYELNFNGSTWDRRYSNVSGVIKAAGQTATTTTSQVTYNAQRLAIILNVASGTGTVQVTVNATTSSGYSYPLLVGTTQTGTGVSVFRIGPGLNASSGLVANDLLPRTVSVVATVTGTVAYGIDYVLGV